MQTFNYETRQTESILIQYNIQCSGDKPFLRELSNAKTIKQELLPELELWEATYERLEFI